MKLLQLCDCDRKCCDDDEDNGDQYLIVGTNTKKKFRASLAWPLVVVVYPAND